MGIVLQEAPSDLDKSVLHPAHLEKLEPCQSKGWVLKSASQKVTYPGTPKLPLPILIGFVTLSSPSPRFPGHIA
jgi:hypothetical protein